MKVAPDRYLSGNSVNWKNWESKLKFTTCAECYKKQGYRNHKRILYSDDGLIFVTYDHYRRFYEIV